MHPRASYWLRAIGRTALALVAIIGIAAISPAPASAQCNVAGSWSKSTANVGAATWTFTPLGGNRYNAVESGLGNARGTATVAGSLLSVHWIAGGYSGRYEWTLDSQCRTGQGRVVFTAGRSGTFSSTITRQGAAPAAARGYYARWLKTGGSGPASWASTWTWYGPEYITTFGRQVCGHGANCNCQGRNYCGRWYVGQTVLHWPYGCNGPAWTLLCQAAQ